MHHHRELSADTEGTSSIECCGTGCSADTHRELRDAAVELLAISTALRRVLDEIIHVLEEAQQRESESAVRE